MYIPNSRDSYFALDDAPNDFDYTSEPGDWIGGFTRLVASRHGTERVALALVMHPHLVCPRCGWLLKLDPDGAKGCGYCGWTNIDDENSGESDIPY